MRRPEAAMARRRVARLFVVTLVAIVTIPLLVIAFLANARSERR